MYRRWFNSKKARLKERALCSRHTTRSKPSTEASRERNAQIGCLTAFHFHMLTRSRDIVGRIRYRFSMLETKTAVYARKIEVLR